MSSREELVGIIHLHLDIKSWCGGHQRDGMQP